MSETRFLKGYREAASDEPGLVQEIDGTVWVVHPDGTRDEVEGGGGPGGLFIPPTTDPLVVGAVWNNQDTLRVSLGPDPIIFTLSPSGSAAFSPEINVVIEGNQIAEATAVTFGGTVAEIESRSSGGGIDTLGVIVAQDVPVDQPIDVVVTTLVGDSEPVSYLITS